MSCAVAWDGFTPNFWTEDYIGPLQKLHPSCSSASEIRRSSIRQYHPSETFTQKRQLEQLFSITFIHGGHRKARCLWWPTACPGSLHSYAPPGSTGILATGVPRSNFRDVHHYLLRFPDEPYQLGKCPRILITVDLGFINLPVLRSIRRVYRNDSVLAFRLAQGNPLLSSQM